MKKYLFFLILLATLATLCGINTATASPISGPSSDSAMAQDSVPGLTDEEFQAYEDSLINAMYPKVRECHLPDSVMDTFIAGIKKNNNTHRPYNPPTPDPVVPDRVNIDKTRHPGEIKVKSGVTATGARTFEIPLEIYRDPNGFHPELKLVYNSHAGGSVVGHGWSLSDIPVITRGAKTVYHDDRCEGIRMDDTDAFFLGNLRLLKTQSASGYILYETELGNIKAKAHVSGKTVTYFEVSYPDGNRAIFGHTMGTANSRLHYPITSLTDIHGNRIDYSYDFSGNCYRITKISYGNAHVKFFYSTRMDDIISFSGGQKLLENRLLYNITCSIGDSDLGSYRLYHSLHDNISHLDSISYSAGGNAFNPVKFIYGEGAQPPHPRRNYYSETTNLKDWYASDLPMRLKAVRGRIGYGSMDDGLVVVPDYPTYWQHYRHSTVFRHSQNRFDNYYCGEENIYLYTGLSQESASPMPVLKTEPGFIDIMCADLKGSQRESVVRVNNIVHGDNDRVTFTVFNPDPDSGMKESYRRTYDFPTVYMDADKGKSIQPKFYYAGDFNGDGKMEILAVSVHQPFGDPGKPTKCYLFDLEGNRILFEDHVFPYNVAFAGTSMTDPWWARNNSDTLMAFDVDGDGKTDICVINESGVHSYTFDTSPSGGLTLRRMTSDTVLKRGSLQDCDILAGDLNGDGLIDLLVSPARDATVNPNHWSVFYSMGDGRFSESWFQGPRKPNAADAVFLLQDVDGDGRSDLLFYNRETLYTALSKFNKIGERETGAAPLPGSNSVVVPAGVNGHRFNSSLLCLHDGTVTKLTHGIEQSRERLLTGMISSLGLIEKSEYKSLCDSEDVGGVYTPGSGATFPHANIHEPIMVISCTEKVFDGKILGKSCHTYENAVFHRQGLGFRGFEKVTSTDSRGNRTVRTFDPYNHGVLKSVESPSSKTVNTYSVDVKPNKVKKILLDKKKEEDLLTGYSADYSYTYDQYGYPLTETATYSDGIMVKTELSYGDSSGTDGAYSLGFVTDRTVTTTRDGDTYVERTNFPEFERRHPLAAVKYVNGNRTERTGYTYDSHGNVTKEMITPYDSPNSLTSEYSYTDTGQLETETDPWGLLKTYTYDSYGRVSAIKGYTGTTYIQYDTFGRETCRKYPDGTKNVVSYEWVGDNSPGVYKVTTEETGSPAVSESYDALGRVVRRADVRPDGKLRKTDMEYDAHGDLAKESDPYTGSTPTGWTTYGYDTHGRPLTATEPSGRETRHSYSGSEVITGKDGVDIRRGYDSQGNLILSSDAAGDVTYNLAADGQPVTVVCPGGIYYWFYYDKYRRQDYVIDASAGIVRYRYDQWGNVNWRGAYGKDISYEYDDLNRLKKTVTPEFTTTLTYDGYSRLTDIVSDNGTSRSLSYDQYGRTATCRDTGADGKWLLREYAYTDGNVSSVRYTSQTGIDLTEKYMYSNGTFTQGTCRELPVYRLCSEWGDGSPSESVTGPLARKHFYSRGIPTGYTVRCGNRPILNFSYDIDPATRCLDRRLNANGRYEEFAYDNLNRLVSDGAEEFSYNPWGNVTGRSGVGTFEYGLPDKPHAITGIVPTGDNVPLHTQEISYTSFSRPQQIKEGEYTASFTYNGDYDRVRMTVEKGGKRVLDRHYLGGCYELDTRGARTLEKLYLFGDYYDAPAVYIRENGEEKVHYILRDYLGSVTHVVNARGDPLQETSYSAWGTPRDPETLEPRGGSQDDEQGLYLGRGFTGHEHLPWFGLINMNARLYDPLTCRFLSPDPQVQMPDFTQGLNRFSYALNNPFMFVDQDGEFFWAAVGIAAFIGGTINLVTHWDAVQAGGFWKGVQYFATGAVAGGVGAAVGIGAAVGFGGMLGVTVASYTAATTGFINGALAGAAGGAAGGFISEAGNSLIEGQGLGNSLLNGLYGAASGAISGGLTGGITGGIQAKQLGMNFWNGAAPDPSRHFSVYYGLDPVTGEVKYVGMTGRKPEIRFAEHQASGTNRANLNFVVKNNNFTKLEARIWEQSQINKYGMMKNGGQLFNLRNEIAQKYWHLYDFNINTSKVNQFQLWLRESLRR